MRKTEVKYVVENIMYMTKRSWDHCACPLCYYDSKINIKRFSRYTRRNTLLGELMEGNIKIDLCWIQLVEERVQWRLLWKW